MDVSSLFCRACLKKAVRSLVPFDDNFIDGYNLLTNLNIKLQDELPQFVCQICFNTVSSFVKFRAKCIASEAILQEQLLQTVKSEPDEPLDQNRLEGEIEKNIEIPSVLRRVGRPRKATINDWNENSLKKIKITTTAAVKKRVGRPRKNVSTTETNNKTWVIRPRKDTTTTPNESNKCIGCPNKNISTKSKSKKWVICPRKDITFQKIENNETNSCVDLSSTVFNSLYESELLIPVGKVIKSCDLSIKEETETPDDDNVFDNLDNTVPDLEIERVLVKNEDLEDVVKSKTIKPAKSKKEEDTSIPCGLCKKKLENQESLFSHLESHRSYTRCEICQETFTEWQALLAHRLQHVKIRKHQKCHICLKPQRSPLYIEYHYLSVHSDKDIKDVTMTCKICLKKVRDPYKMKKHLKYSHREVQYICDKCSKGYVDKLQFIKHVKLHNVNKLHVCNTCGYSSKSQSNLRVHIWRKHTNNIRCTICSRAFKTKEKFDQHVCPVKKERVCPICGIVTKLLQQHLGVHSDERKYACERCPATFKSKSALRVHMNKHGDLRPHRCEFCPMRFNSPAVLWKHRRVHTGEKPYVCKICSKGFTGNNNLKVHMRVHGENLVVKRNATQPQEPNFSSVKI